MEILCNMVTIGGIYLSHVVKQRALYINKVKHVRLLIYIRFTFHLHVCDLDCVCKTLVYNNVKAIITSFADDFSVVLSLVIIQVVI